MENILFTFWIFEQLALALKNRGFPEFTVPNIYFFIIQEFWVTCTFPEKQNCPGIFHCTEIYFIIQDFWGTCGCPENRVCPEIFQARVGGRPNRDILVDWPGRRDKSLKTGTVPAKTGRMVCLYCSKMLMFIKAFINSFYWHWTKYTSFCPA